ncbi:MAG: hypothetical protein QM756_47020 [Polyangiaceae bacterium]
MTAAILSPGLLVAVCAAMLSVSGCSSDSEGSNGSGGHANYGGASFGGTGFGGAFGGQTTYPLGGRVTSSGGETSGTSTSGSPGSGGLFQGAGGTSSVNSGGKGGAAGGTTSATLGGSTGTVAGSGSWGVSGGYPAMVPPPPASNGNSPYLTECHGDTKSCVDVANLRCLGIRDGATVNGYSCSNPCMSDADCSSAPTGVAATAACIDFVNQKHCLLVCLSGGASKACPTGMSCYVYPGSNVGYCLWAP